MRQIQRQGDVLLVPTTKPTAKLTPIPLESGRAVLAIGEVTGHSHTVEAVQFVVNEATLQRYFRTDKPTTVRHEEHGALELPSGWYEVRIQREYERGTVRNVAD